MSQLTYLKQKINSINTTKKITHAIRLVAMSLYSRLEKQSLYIQNYKNNINKTFNKLHRIYPEWKNNILFPDDILDKNPLFIIISSSKGLCGSFNGNLFRYINETLFIEEHQKPSFITLGQKAKNFIEKEKKEKLLCCYNEPTINNFVDIANKLTKQIINASKKYSSISFFNNQLKNFFIQKPQKGVLTPLSTEKESDELSKEENDKVEFDYILEQDKDTILNNLAQKYIKSFILNVLFQSLISENAARFLAMDGANNNAKKLLENLTLQFNKSRQALITKEVSELSVNM